MLRGGSLVGSPAKTWVQKAVEEDCRHLATKCVWEVFEVPEAGG